MRILFFAQAAQVMRRREIGLSLGRPATLREVLLRPELSPLGAIPPGTRYAVNEEFAGSDALVCDGDVVAVLPPVSGG